MKNCYIQCVHKNAFFGMSYLVFLLGIVFSKEFILVGNESKKNLYINSSDSVLLSLMNFTLPTSCGLIMYPLENATNYAIHPWFDFWCNGFHTYASALVNPNDSFNWNNYTLERNCLSSFLSNWIPSYLNRDNELHCSDAWYIQKPQTNANDGQFWYNYPIYTGGNSNSNNTNYWWFLLGIGGFLLMVIAFFFSKKKK